MGNRVEPKIKCYLLDATLVKCYQQQLGSSAVSATDTEIGWYAYLLNEYWQYACGSLLWAIVAQLEEFGEQQYLPDFIRQVVDSIVEGINHDMYIPNSLEEVLTRYSPDWTEESDILDIEKFIHSKDSLQTAVHGFCLLFRLLINNADFIPQVGLYIYQQGVRRDGNMVEGLLFIENARNQEFSAFVEQFIYRYIINRHRLVAMRKMGNGFQATHKFIIEENFIRPVENFIPRFTSPRMGAVTNLLLDLQLIKYEGDRSSLSGFEELFNS